MLTFTFIYRDSESEYLSTLSSSLTQGTTWERIAALVELENSQSKTIGRNGPGQFLSLHILRHHWLIIHLSYSGTTDLTRFKEVLLRLKREGTSAPGAAGY